MSMSKVIVALCLLTTGCSAQLGSSRSRSLERELEMLKQRVLELQQRATADGVEIERLRQKVSLLEARLDEPRLETTREDAPRDLDEETVPPRAVEVIEVSDLEEPLEESSSEITSEEREPEGRLEAAAAPEEVSEGGGSPRPAVGAAAQALYDQGYTLYHQGRLVDAEETFHRFLAAYAATDLADNAQYWIGESRLARNELQAALAAFRETVRTYPDGNKTPDALLKVGEVLERLGDREGARASYSEVVRRFPESPAAQRAESRLQGL